ncbi:MAG TPA: DUF4112 domain-containing protein [Halococcus sp.]|nr:DUF4112 domain-containing protein [Halococcus sp.]
MTTNSKDENTESTQETDVPERLETLSYLLDDAISIPGTNYRIGIDPILGLVPVGGDALALVPSLYIVLEAAYMGLSTATIGRMLVNVFLDATIGSIPLIGTIFDAVWKANTRNLSLLRARARKPAPELDKRFLVVAILVIGISVLAFTVLTVLIAFWIVSELAGLVAL